MNAGSGRTLRDLPHIAQSVATIIGTSIGSRVMRRDFGSLVPDLIDAPSNAVGMQLLRAAIVSALQRWEPRITVTRIAFRRGAADGQMLVDLDFDRIDGARREAAQLQVPLRGLAA
ncbi:hypothetical protein SAMN02745857_01778 [Andreprevotia lacus DSM 23236]|uniref:IraD/Gp25-like domain-containing protein n=1 Tax=Andreprevotia lacus DSM 23236 TaxID=1121001 RepID=A0A1W1XJR9_9NEIS|nr:GPW/gp25 family protein [Andreprevotia lacus]SMC24233.1 hypothetical protein SAMN02745857_01778 [Andreprevotia lacus DSM 23236]